MNAFLGIAAAVVSLACCEGALAATAATAPGAADSAARSAPPPATPSGCTAVGCHLEFTQRTHPHAPVAAGECASCHVAGTAKHPDRGTKGFSPAKVGAELCRTCHSRWKGNRSVHAPVSEGECSSCHDPHGSANAKLLVKPTPGALCADCHDVGAKAAAARTPHPPALEECTECHDPHTSAQPHLLRAAVNEVCFRCHDSREFALHAVNTGRVGSGHPLKADRDPARKGESFSCASCHDPHSTNTPSLLRFEAQTPFDLCQHCHPL